jgi:hypothetical protein
MSQPTLSRLPHPSHNRVPLQPQPLGERQQALECGNEIILHSGLSEVRF